MIIVIGSRKGGSGKSTIATNIACALAKTSKVMLVDADHQPTSSEWWEERLDHKELPIIQSVQKYGKIQSQLIEFEKVYDYVLVDCSGKDSIELRNALSCANILLIPVRPSQPDLNTLPYIHDLIDEILTINPKLKSYVLLTQAPTNPKIDSIKSAKEVFNDYPKLIPISQILFDRQIYRDAMAEGKGVIEAGNDKASEEIRGLIKEIFDGNY